MPIARLSEWLSGAKAKIERIGERKKFQKLASAQYQTWLRIQQTNEEPFPQSDGPENPLALESGNIEKYREILEDYSYTNAQKDKYDFKDPNIGYKLHLNVTPENANAVSEYLVTNGYFHKYLSPNPLSSQDIVQQGKIFTIYIGSKDLTQKLSQTISKDLHSYLCKPIDKRSIEIAPNVAARFVAANNPHLTGYPSAGVRGIPVLRFYNGIELHGPVPRETQEKALTESYQAAEKMFGAYFTGGSPE